MSRSKPQFKNYDKIYDKPQSECTNTDICALVDLVYTHFGTIYNYTDNHWTDVKLGISIASPIETFITALKTRYIKTGEWHMQDMNDAFACKESTSLGIVSKNMYILKCLSDEEYVRRLSNEIIFKFTV